MLDHLHFKQVRQYYSNTLYVENNYWLLFTCSTDDLKIAIAAEAKSWKILFGRSMNTKYLGLMEKIMEQIEDLSRRLLRPINDLDDVRQAMASLKEMRENEIYIDSSLNPVEVSFGNEVL